jgi:hypothetical protein
MPKFVSFDHDLGPRRVTGMDFARWLIGYVMDKEVDVSDFDFYVHSQNPVGAENIRSYMRQGLEEYQSGPLRN